VSWNTTKGAPRKLEQDILPFSSVLAKGIQLRVTLQINLNKFVYLQFAPWQISIYIR